jgi:hypothetical protein
MLSDFQLRLNAVAGSDKIQTSDIKDLSQRLGKIYDYSQSGLFGNVGYGLDVSAYSETLDKVMQIQKLQSQAAPDTGRLGLIEGFLQRPFVTQPASDTNNTTNNSASNVTNNYNITVEGGETNQQTAQEILTTIRRLERRGL